MSIEIKEPRLEEKSMETTWKIMMYESRKNKIITANGLKIDTFRKNPLENTDKKTNFFTFDHLNLLRPLFSLV